MSTYNIIAASNESTVVAEYTPESARSDSFQSEAALEKEFIRLLCEQGYEYLSVHDESGLITNLRRQLEVLNNYTFTDSEWKRFFTEILANATILSMRNILSSFDQFEEMDSIAARDLQNYQSIYLDLYDKYRKKGDAEKEDITDDIEFEIELIKQVEINIDYILMLVEKYHDGNCEDKEILTSIRKAVDASMQLRSKKELIEAFISQVNVDTQVTDDWRRFVLEQEETDLTEIITSEKLKPEETRKFVANAFRDGALKTTGTEIDKLMPPVSRFGGGSRAKKKQGIIEKLKVFFEKYFGLGIAELKAEEEKQNYPE